MKSVPNDGVGSTDPMVNKIKAVLSSFENVDDPAVLAADIALRAFGDAITRDQAARLLPMWKGYSELSAEQVAAVLDRFGGAL